MVTVLNFIYLGYESPYVVESTGEKLSVLLALVVIGLPVIYLLKSTIKMR